MAKAPFSQPISCWCIEAKLIVEARDLRAALRKVRHLEPTARFVAVCEIIQQLLHRMHQYALAEFYGVTDDPSFLPVELEVQQRSFEPLRKMLHSEMKQIIKTAATQGPEAFHASVTQWLLHWREHIPSYLEYVPQAKNYTLGERQFWCKRLQQRINSRGSHAVGMWVWWINFSLVREIVKNVVYE